MSSLGSLVVTLGLNYAQYTGGLDKSEQAALAASKKIQDSFDGLRSTLSSAAGVIAATMGVGELIRLTDQYTKYTAQLKLATDNTAAYASAMGQVRAIATAAQQDISAIGTLFARISNGTQELGLSQQKVAVITETVALSLKVSGAAASESASAMLQLSQAFASGQLRGEEFNAVNEAAPRLMKALADGIGVPVGALREMATEGRITSEVMANALPRALEELREEAKSVQTIAGAFTVLKNNFLEFVGTQAQASDTVRVLTAGIDGLANNLNLITAAAGGFAAAKIAETLIGVAAATARGVGSTVAYAESLTAQRTAALAAAQAEVGATAAMTARIQATQSAIVISQAEYAAKLASANATISSSQAALQQAAAVIASSSASLQAARSAGTLSFALATARESSIALTGAQTAQAAATETLALAERKRSAAIAELAILGQQQARVSAQVTAATTAQAAAQASLSAATSAGGAATGVAMRALGFLGGPIGAITTLLGLGATAWMLWGNASKSAQDKAADAVELTTAEIISNLDKQNAKLRERIELGKQLGLAIGQEPTDGEKRQASIGRQIRNLQSGMGVDGGAPLPEAARVALMQTLLRQYGELEAKIGEGKALKGEDAQTKAANDLIAVRQRLLGVNKQYLEDLATYKKALDAGAISEEKYVQEVSALAREVYDSSAAGKAAKAGKKIAEAKDLFDALRDSVVKATAAYQAEAAAGEKLTEGQKKAVEVLDQIRTGKVKVTEVQAIQIGLDVEAMLAAEAENKAREEFIKTADAERAARLKVVQVMEQSAASLVQQNQAMREEIEMIGLSEAAQLQILQSRNSVLILTKEATLAELERASAITGTMTREQIALQAEIEALRERNELLGAKYDRTITAKAATEAANEWTKFYDSIYNGLSDSLYRGFEAGKGFFKSFWDGIKNLFKTTVLKLAVQGVMTGITGSLGLTVTGANAGVTGGAGGGGGLGMLSGLGNIVSSGFDLITKGVSSAVSNAFGNFASSDLGVRLGLSAPVDYGTGYTANVMTPMGSNIGAGLGMLGNGVMGYGISQAISGGYSVGGGNAVNIIAGIASAFFGPIAGVVGGVINRLFGRKLADVGIEGTFGGKTGFEGQQYEFYKGGLLRSDKTKYKDLDPEFEKALGDTFKGMRAQVAYFADTLGLSADKLEGYTSKIKISTQGLNAEQIQQKFQEALATANNELAEQVLGTWETTSEKVRRTITRTEGHGEDMVQYLEEVEETITKTAYKASEYAKEGEKAIDTLTRLSTSLTTVNGIFDTLGYTLLDASLKGADAASKIADAFGGLDKMVAATSSYFQNFYSEEERRAVATRQLDGEFAKLGLTVPKTRAEYRRLVEAQDLNTEAGRKAYAMLIMLSGSFAELTQTAEEAAAAAAAAAKEAFKAQLDEAYGALERSIAAQRKVLEAQRDAAAELANLWGSIADIASSAMRELRGEVGSTAAQQAAQGMVFIENALQRALLGIIPNADDLSNALTAARGGLTADNYLSQFELDRDRLVLAGQMEQLAGVAGKQKSIAEQSLDALNRQIKQGEETLDYWKKQIDIATGNVKATVSVEQAIKDLQALMFPETNLKAPEKVPGSGGFVIGGGGGGSGSGAPSKPGSGFFGAGGTEINHPASVARFTSIRDYTNTLDFSAGNKGNAVAELGRQAAIYGVDYREIAIANGYRPEDVARMFEEAGVTVPRYAVGTNYVPNDGLAYLHEGEAVVPKAYNPAANPSMSGELAYLPPARIYTASTTRRMLAGAGSGVGADGEGLVLAVANLAVQVELVREEIKVSNGHAKKSADALDGASESGVLRVTLT